MRSSCRVPWSSAWQIEPWKRYRRSKQRILRDLSTRGSYEIGFNAPGVVDSSPLLWLAVVLLEQVGLRKLFDRLAHFRFPFGKGLRLSCLRPFLFLMS